MGRGGGRRRNFHFHVSSPVGRDKILKEWWTVQTNGGHSLQCGSGGRGLCVEVSSIMQVWTLCCRGFLCCEGLLTCVCCEGLLTIVFAGMIKDCSPSPLSFLVILCEKSLHIYQNVISFQCGKNYSKSQILAVLWFRCYSRFFCVHIKDEVKLLFKLRRKILFLRTVKGLVSMNQKE